MKRMMVLCAVGALSPLALAADWNESVDGDLSTDPSTPTPIVFGLGGNVITGDVQAPGDTRDYLTFTIAPGQVLTSILQWQWEDLTLGGPGNTGYTAINAGATSLIPSAGNAASFLGGNHLTPQPAGTDILPGLAAAALAGTGFTAPLGPGTYSYVIQQTGPEHTGYSLEFVVTPSPGTGLLALSGSLFLARRRR